MLFLVVWICSVPLFIISGIWFRIIYIYIYISSVYCITITFKGFESKDFRQSYLKLYCRCITFSSFTSKDILRIRAIHTNPKRFPDPNLSKQSWRWRRHCPKHVGILVGSHDRRWCRRLRKTSSSQTHGFCGSHLGPLQRKPSAGRCRLHWEGWMLPTWLHTAN